MYKELAKMLSIQCLLLGVCALLLLGFITFNIILIISGWILLVLTVIFATCNLEYETFIKDDRYESEIEIII